MTDSIRTLAVQYFQLVDPPHLAIPPGNVLVQPAVQQALYEHMFDETLTPLPPATYRTRVLKQILARIEEAITDPEEDVCSITSTFLNDTVHNLPSLTYLRKSPTV
jgi:hypothetical protein